MHANSLVAKPTTERKSMKTFDNQYALAKSDQEVVHLLKVYGDEGYQLVTAVLENSEAGWWGLFFTREVIVPGELKAER